MADDQTAEPLPEDQDSDESADSQESVSDAVPDSEEYAPANSFLNVPWSTESMPGSGDCDLSTVEGAINCLDTHIKEALEKIHGDIKHTHEDALAQIQAAHGLIGAAISLGHDSIGPAIEKAARKILLAVGQSLSHAQSYVSQVNLPQESPGNSVPGLAPQPPIVLPIPFPQPWQVVYGNATGDYLGSMGLDDVQSPDSMDEVKAAFGVDQTTKITIKPGDSDEQETESGDTESDSDETSASVDADSSDESASGPEAESPKPVDIEVEPPPRQDKTLIPVCPPGRPASPCLTVDCDYNATVPNEWQAYLQSVQEGTLQYECLTPTEQYVWALVQGTEPEDCPEGEDEDDEDESEDVDQPVSFAAPAPPDLTPNPSCLAAADWVHALSSPDKPLSQTLGFLIDANGNVQGPAWFNGMFPPPGGDVSSTPTSSNFLGRWIDSLTSTQAAVQNEAQDVNNLNNGVSLIVRNSVGKVIIGVLDGIGWAFRNMPPIAGENTGALVAIGLLKSPFEFISKWTGIEIDKILSPYRQMENIALPTELPGIEELDTLLNHGLINKANWECMIQASNAKLDWHKMVHHSNRTRPELDQLWKLYDRGKISIDELTQQSKSWGVTEDRDFKLLKYLADYYPDPATITEAYVRGIYDDGIVADDLLDQGGSDFAASQAGQVLAGNGYSPAQITDAWAAHWTPPQWFQVLQMHWRAQAGLLIGGLSVGLDDVQRVMAQNGIAPGWQQYLIAAATPILDIRRLTAEYLAGAVGDGAVLSALTADGYVTKDRDAILAMLKYRRYIELGGLSPKAWVDAYKSYEVNGQDLQTNLTEMGIDADTISKLQLDATRERQWELRKSMLANVKARFLATTLDRGDTMTALTAINLDSQQIAEVMAAWTLELESKGKEIGAGQLCKLFSDKLITGKDYYNRLVRFGYGATDAKLIVEECGITIDKQAEAAAAKAAKAAAAAAKSAAKKPAGKPKASAPKSSASSPSQNGTATHAGG
jgi:hypothetical protein